MKTITKLLTLLLILGLVSCSKNSPDPQNNDFTVHGSGNLVSKEIAAIDVDRLEVGLYFTLTIRQGTEASLRITSDDNFIDFIQVQRVGSRLVIGLDPAYAYNLSNVTLLAEATLPDLAGLTLSGSSQAVLLEARSLREFQAVLSGSSRLTGSLQANAASLELSGSTSAELAGTAQQLQLESCGNSVAHLEQFVVENAVLAVSCNSQTAVTVTGRLEINASQSAQVFYAGDPTQVISASHENALVEQN